jgi:multidrug transporter EmrE-like cation transporter
MHKFTALSALAAVSYSFGGYFMKLSAGFQQALPTVLVFTLFALGTYLQTVAMQGEEMSITYIVVLGFEAISALSLSVFLLKEGSSATKLLGVGLVLVGIVLLRSGKA